ncbi:MAG TPA: hypothetical protein DD379_12410 [Cyanobacteria bacterium UBA11162]|nr:hypothetical protein [Cyanobacteria bacterium UBA11162]
MTVNQILKLTIGKLINFSNFAFIKWQNYWFKKDGFLSIGICRIAVFLSILLTHLDITPLDYQILLDSKPLELYDPVGVLKFFGDTPPSASFLELCESVAFFSTCFAIAGLLSRISMPVSVVSNLILVSLRYSWQPYWSHGMNVVFIAGLAFMFGRAGDSLSLDALIKRFFKKQPFRQTELKPNYAYQWSIFLAQFAVAFMFANACFWKLSRDHFQFGWVFSDNLRNYLALGWYRSKGPPPFHVSWIMSHEWAWKALALSNIIAQGTTILACFFVRRPIWRFIFGSLFFLETWGLGIVVGLWHLEWLPLTALFVDWDRFIPWLAHQLKRIPIGDGFYQWVTINKSSRLEPVERESEIIQSSVTQPRERQQLSLNKFRTRFWRGCTTLYILLFSGYYIYTAMAKADRVHRNYPFSAFTVYSAIMAEKPYHKHTTIEYFASQIDIKTAHSELSDSIKEKLNRTYKKLYRIKDSDEIRLRLKGIMKNLRLRYKINDVEELELTTIIWQIPAYPAHHQPIAVHKALMGILDKSGKLYSASGRVNRDKNSDGYVLNIGLEGYKEPEIRIGYRLNLSGEIKPLEGNFKGRRFYFVPKETGTYHLVIFVKESSIKGTLRKEKAFFGPDFRIKDQK